MPYEERSTPTAADVEKGKNSANNESGNEEESESTGGIGQLVQEGRRLKTKSREEKEVIISPNNMGQTIHTPPTSPSDSLGLSSQSQEFVGGNCCGTTQRFQPLSRPSC